MSHPLMVHLMIDRAGNSAVHQAESMEMAQTDTTPTEYSSTSCRKRKCWMTLNRLLNRAILIHSSTSGIAESTTSEEARWNVMNRSLGLSNRSRLLE